MTYQVLYRTWRPQDFAGLVGQEPIRRTLENALLQGHINHAYLFSGPRGTGKTSTARILAKALNCACPQGVQPCGQCESCRSIQNGNSMDVLEIDAASNRGIEEIRELKEKLGFMPALGKYKVYIIDEVHMLTTEAFNALLKTLEEPPAHVVFVLATTDVQKLPATILSRCQRFDFRKISDAVIGRRLQEIVASLAIPVEAGVYPLIIKRADGGLRDAISLLDQCLAFSPAGVSTTAAYQVLGLVRQDALYEMMQAITTQNPQKLFLQIDQLLQEGVEPIQLLRDLAEHCRNLIMLLVCGKETELVLTAADRQTLLEQGQGLGVQRLQMILTALDQGTAGGKGRGNARFMAEALLAGLMILPQAKTATTQVPGAQQQPVERQQPIEQQQPVERQQPVARQVPPIKKNMAKAKSESEQNSADWGADFGKGSHQGISGSIWEQILQGVKAQRIVLHAFLMASVEQTLENKVLTVNFDPEKGKFHKERAEEGENRRILQEVVNQVMEPDIRIEYGFKKEETEMDPLKKALAIFGEEIVQIKQ